MSREQLVRFIYAVLDRTELYDDEGLLRTDESIDKDPWTIPDLTDTGAAAILADALLAANIVTLANGEPSE